MNIKKIILSLVLVSFYLPAQADLNIFSCEPEWAALATQLGGDKIKVFSATTGLQDPHHIQARPSLIARIRKADLLICTGADLEIGWLPLLLRRSNNSKIKPGQPGNFVATEYVRLLGIPKLIDRSQGDVHAAGNPHIQTNPKNILRVAKAFHQRLVELDASNSGYYDAQFETFSKHWKKALKHWKTMTKPLTHLKVVVHHDSWVYLKDYLKLNQLATLEDKPGIPPTSGHLNQLLKTMKSNPAKVIFHAAYQPEKASNWLSKRTNIPAIVLPFTVGGTEQATDLFQLYEDTFNRLLKAVQK